MLREYLFIFCYFCFLIVLSCIIFFFSYGSVDYNDDNEKGSAYECGFDPYVDARVRFEVRYYIVAILFVIFDLEIVFLFPYMVVYFVLGLWGFVLMFLFFFILVLGFIYEWSVGALDWY